MKKTCIQVWLLCCLLLSPSLTAAEGKPLRAAFIVQGTLLGESGMSPEQRDAAKKQVETLMDSKLAKSLGIRKFDQDSLAKAKADKAQWAALTGGNAGDIMKILEESKLDALIRVFYRAAPSTKQKDRDGNDLFTGTASMTAEAISLASGEKSAVVWSPSMGAFNAEEQVAHPAQKGADAFAASMAALSYAGEQVAGRLAANPSVKCLVTGTSPPETQKDDLRVFFIVDGKIKIRELAEQDKRVGTMRVEALLNDKMKKAVGIRNFDNDVLKKVKENAGQWAALGGGNAGDIMKVLAKHNIDAFIRVAFRAAPAYKMKRAGGPALYSGTASVTAEVIFPKSGEKAEFLESPAMGTVKHPAVRALDPFVSGISALSYATDRIMEQLHSSDSLMRLREGRKLISKANPDGEKAMFVVTGDLLGSEPGEIDTMEQRVASLHLESVLNRQFRKSLGLVNFDDTVLTKVRADAGQWMALTGGNVADIEKVLAVHQVDRLVKVNYRAQTSFKEKDENGNAIYLAKAHIRTVIINRKTGEPAQIFESPEMSTEAARTSIDPFEAGIAALDAQSTNMLVAAGLMEVPKAVAAPPDNEKPALPAKPTVAVLWVKPGPKFSGWSAGRSRNPVLGMKKKKQIRKFVEHVKKTGDVGIEVCDYLIQGLVASGSLIPIEQAQGNQEKMVEVQNKLLEYRMAGWVGEKLPFDDPLQVAKTVGADYVVTAYIHKISESSKSFSAIAFSAGSITATAEVEVIVTNTRTGATQRYTDTGSFKKSGYGTVMAFNPAGMKLDKMLIGGAVKEAIFNAAKKVSVTPN